VRAICSCALHETSICSLCFEVTDTGIGIEEDRLDKIFNPFAQADSSTTRRYGGSGLGLSISRELAVMMGGTLTARANHPQGTTFRFESKVIIASPAGRQPLKHPDHQRIENGPRILVADDHELNRMCISLMLRERGLACDLATNGQEALEAARTGQYKIIFMDCQMPGLDGYAATQRIRQENLNYSPAIIALTANALEGEKQRCFEAGMDDYIAKPIDFERMFELIGRYSGEPEDKNGNS